MVQSVNIIFPPGLFDDVWIENLAELMTESLLLNYILFGSSLENHVIDTVEINNAADTSDA